MTEEERIINFSKLYSEITKKCRFSDCLYPDSKNCSNKVITSHSIQSALLKKISINGRVWRNWNKSCLNIYWFL